MSHNACFHRFHPVPWIAALAVSLAAAGCLNGDKDSDIEFLHEDSGVIVEPLDAGIESPDGGDPDGGDDEDAGEADASTQDAGNPEDCLEGYVYDALAGGCVEDGPTVCFDGYHDGGNGECVLLGYCSDGFELDEEGECVEEGACPSGQHDGGDGQCVPEGTCSASYHDGGDGGCLPEGTCAAGYHDDGVGGCMSQGCAPNFAMAGGVCARLVEFIDIPAGTFLVRHAIPGHDIGREVIVPAFQLGLHPVTVAEFTACVEDGACTADGYQTVTDDTFCNHGRGGEWLEQPMNCVFPAGAAAFCAWIGGELPTEVQWEYAATHDGTASLRSTYPWGATEPGHCVHASYTDAESNLHCDGTVRTTISTGTSRVGVYPSGKSPLGLEDMAGNVWEITASSYATDDSTPVAKGGAWNFSAEYLPVTSRIPFDAHYQYTSYGFRCVLPK